MEEKPEYPTRHTASGTPYVEIPCSSTTPIYLTELYASDKPRMVEILNTPAIVNSLIAIPTPYKETDYDWWFGEQQGGKSNLRLQSLRHSSPGPDGEFIGSVSLKQPEQLGGEFEVGYYLDPAWQRKGIMRSAVKGLVEWALREGAGVREGGIMIRVLEENKGSRKVVETATEDEKRNGEWVKVEERSEMIDWPEVKGGGRKMLWYWKWELRPVA